MNNVRALMAHAQQLTEKVKSQNTRIKELEDALSQALDAAGADENHPLLIPSARGGSADEAELGTIYDNELEGVSDTMGSLSIGLEGQAKYYGETASSEVCVYARFSIPRMFIFSCP
jgi:hypothetical protein